MDYIAARIPDLIVCAIGIVAIVALISRVEGR